MDTFRCYLVSKDAAGRFAGRVETLPVESLPDGDVLIRVAYSSLNYKDALSATGNPGVTRTFPHVPGIDAAGAVVESRSAAWRAGDKVIVTGFDFGSNHSGGYAELVRVPAEWVLPLPAGLTLRESMILGTAGLTAGLSVAALAEHGVAANAGEVAVTGASGGVGSLSVAILAKLGYYVTAVSGKPTAHSLLTQLGAERIVPRQEVDDNSAKPLLSARWAGAVDTVGGNSLATLLRATKPAGCVTACGLVGGVDLPLTVFPFILRGVTLVGIDSGWVSLERRASIWKSLAGAWKPAALESIVTEIDLAELDPCISEILAGRITGRVLVRITS